MNFKMGKPVLRGETFASQKIIRDIQAEVEDIMERIERSAGLRTTDSDKAIIEKAEYEIRLLVGRIYNLKEGKDA